MPQRLVGRSRTTRTGAAALELIVVTPFLVFMFAVVADYCRIYYAAQVVNNAARAGALYATSTVTAANGLSPQQAAQQAVLAEAASLSPPLRAADVIVTISNSNATVAVTYQFSPISPNLLGLPPQIPVSATVTMPLSPLTSPRMRRAS
jgi:Flp pilus assembly protein TadG